MRKFYFTLAISILIQTSIFSQTAPISFSLPTTKFCPGQIFPISFTNDPSLDGHTFQVQLSNSSGSFASGVSILGSGMSSPISCTMISSSTTSTSLYRIRIIDITAPANISGISNVITINSLSSSLSSYPLDSLGNSTTSSTICTGSSLKLYAITSLHDNYGSTYEWRKTSNPSMIISTNPSFIVTQSDSYNVKVSKLGCTSQTTSSSSISFSSSISSNTFVTFQSELNCIGSTKALATKYYSDFATYEWSKNGTVMAGETNRVLNVSTTGLYSVKVTDMTCQGTGTAGNIIFGNNIDVQINSDTDTVKICTGSSFNFQAKYSVINGNTIEWFRNGVSLAPATQHTLTNRFYTTNIEGVYTYKITEGICSVMSSPVVLKNVSSFSPKIIKDSENTTCVNPTILKVVFPPFFNGAYQWKNAGVVISGATSTSYSTGTASGSYTFRVTQGSCIGESDPVNISVVNDNPPYTIISSPIVCSMGYKLSMNPLYPNPYYSNTSYQWFKDNIAISGATTSSYNALTSGVYKLRITKNTCIGFSQDLTVTINSYLGSPDLVISQFSKGGGYPFQCTGNSVSIRSQDPNLSPVGLIWKKDGVNIPNPNTLTNGILSNVTNVTSTGTYTMSYTFGNCTVESNPIKINIGNKQQSIKTNNWNDSSSWACGTVPIVTDEVIINKGHTISLPDNYTGFLKNLELNGVLQKGNNAQLKFQTN